MEVVTVLALVVCCIGGDLDTPSDTLDVGDRARIRAVGTVRANAWVTLEVDVEGLASIQLIAIACATDGVVAIQCLVAEI